METDLTEAKALFFDRKYEESRAKWAEIAASKGPEREAATYWIARCSESLGENERAFREYGAFLDLPPADARLAEEAEISRIGLATKLTRVGESPGYLTAVHPLARATTAHPVRYFGALQVGSLPNSRRRAQGHDRPAGDREVVEGPGHRRAGETPAPPNSSRRASPRSPRPARSTPPTPLPVRRSGVREEGAPGAWRGSCGSGSARAASRRWR